MSIPQSAHPLKKGQHKPVDSPRTQLHHIGNHTRHGINDGCVAAPAETCPKPATESSNSRPQKSGSHPTPPTGKTSVVAASGQGAQNGVGAAHVAFGQRCAKGEAESQPHSETSVILRYPQLGYSDKLKLLLSPEAYARYQQEMPPPPNGCENVRDPHAPKNLKRQRTKHAIHFRATKKWSELLEKYKLVKKHEKCYVLRSCICNVASCPVRATKVHHYSASHIFCRIRATFGIGTDSKLGILSHDNVYENYWEHMTPQQRHDAAVTAYRKTALGQFRQQRKEALDRQIAAERCDRESRCRAVTPPCKPDITVAQNRSRVHKPEYKITDRRFFKTDDNAVRWVVCADPANSRHARPLNELPVMPGLQAFVEDFEEVKQERAAAEARKEAEKRRAHEKRAEKKRLAEMKRAQEEKKAEMRRDYELKVARDRQLALQRDAAEQLRRQKEEKRAQEMKVAEKMRRDGERRREINRECEYEKKRIQEEREAEEARRIREEKEAEELKMREIEEAYRNRPFWDCTPPQEGRAPRSEPASAKIETLKMAIPQTITPAPKTITPAPRTITPAPKTITPIPQTFTPAPKTITPIPQALSAAPSKSATPAPQSATPAPQSATPAPQSATPAPQSATPAPQSATEDSKPEAENNRPEAEVAQPDAKSSVTLKAPIPRAPVVTKSLLADHGDRVIERIENAIQLEQDPSKAFISLTTSKSADQSGIAKRKAALFDQATKARTVHNKIPDNIKTALKLKSEILVKTFHVDEPAPEPIVAAKNKPVLKRFAAHIEQPAPKTKVTIPKRKVKVVAPEVIPKVATPVQKTVTPIVIETAPTPKALTPVPKTPTPVPKTPTPVQKTPTPPPKTPTPVQEVSVPLQVVPVQEALIPVEKPTLPLKIVKNVMSAFASPVQHLCKTKLEGWIHRSKSELYFQLNMQAIFVPHLDKNTLDLQYLALDLKVYGRTHAEHQMDEFVAHVMVKMYAEKHEDTPRFQTLNFNGLVGRKAPSYRGVSQQTLRRGESQFLSQKRNTALAQIQAVVCAQDEVMVKCKKKFLAQFDIHNRLESYIHTLLENLQAMGKVFVRLCVDMANDDVTDECLGKYEHRLCAILEDLETLERMEKSAWESVESAQKGFSQSLSEVMRVFTHACEVKENSQHQFQTTWKKLYPSELISHEDVEYLLGCYRLEDQIGFIGSCLGLKSHEVLSEKLDRIRESLRSVSEARLKFQQNYNEVASRFMNYVYVSHGVRRSRP